MKKLISPFEVAKDLIRTEVVLYNYTIKQISASQHGSFGGGNDAQVGGWMWTEDNKGQKTSDKIVGTNKILVRRAGGKLVNKIFSLTEVYNALKNEIDQPTLF